MTKQFSIQGGDGHLGQVHPLSTKQNIQNMYKTTFALDPPFTPPGNHCSKSQKGCLPKVQKKRPEGTAGTFHDLLQKPQAFWAHTSISAPSCSACPLLLTWKAVTSARAGRAPLVPSRRKR